jgi:predicted RNA binding protein YcfA (HicA-like mRNA interferase family)
VPKYSVITGKALISARKRSGFFMQRVKGSHPFLWHPDGKSTGAPVHSGDSIGPGLLAKVLRDVGLTRSELEELLSSAAMPANKPLE